MNEPHGLTFIDIKNKIARHIIETRRKITDYDFIEATPLDNTSEEVFRKNMMGECAEYTSNYPKSFVIVEIRSCSIKVKSLGIILVPGTWVIFHQENIMHCPPNVKFPKLESLFSVGNEECIICYDKHNAFFSCTGCSHLICHTCHSKLSLCPFCRNIFTYKSLL